MHFSYVLFCCFALISFTSSVSFVFFVSAILSFSPSVFINPICVLYLGHPVVLHKAKKIYYLLSIKLISISTVYNLYTRAAERFNLHLVIARPLKHIQTKIINAKLVPGCGAESLVFRAANAKTGDSDKSLTAHN